MKKLCSLIMIFTLLTSCSLTNVAVNEGVKQPTTDNGIIETEQPATNLETNAPSNKENNKYEKADELLDSMSLSEKVWQMFFVCPEDIIPVEPITSAGSMTKEAIDEYPVGGILYYGQNIVDRDQITEMISNTQSYSKIPLFIAVDEEGGRVARLGDKNIITKMPTMREIGQTNDTSKAHDVGDYFGEQLKQIGFNMDFAPVADVETVENTDINNRSFGSDPELVSKMVAAEVEAMQAHNVSATLKHFPSNGSANGNTHYSTAVCTRTLEEMRENEFLPFKAGIDAGVDVVMVAHMSPVELVGDTTPATMSEIVIQQYLVGELGYKGVILSDALNMGAITNIYSTKAAAINTVKAGVDMILLSTNPRVAHQAIMDEIEAGNITEERINSSVKKILQLKEKRGLLN